MRPSPPGFRFGGQLAADAVGDGGDPVRHGDGEFGADPDHAAVPARAWRHGPSEVAIWAGILAGSTSFVAAFTSPIWGRLSDRHGRKVMLIRSSIAIGIFTGLMGVAANVWQMFAFRGLMGIFAGFSAAAIALVASQVPEDRLGYSLGWLSTGQLVGSLVGPGHRRHPRRPDRQLPHPVFLHLRDIVRGDGGGVVHRAGAVHRPQRSGGRGSTLSSLFALARSPILLALFFVLLMAQFGIRTVQPIITLYVQEMVGELPNIATLAGIAFSISGLANMIAAPFLGTRSDRFGYRRVLLICLAGAALDDSAAGLRRQLLRVHRRAFRGRAVHRRIAAGGERDGRAAGRPQRARRGVRDERVGDVSRQFPGAADRRRHRGRVRPALGVLMTAR